MRQIAIIASSFLFLFFVSAVMAQPVLDVKTEPLEKEIQNTPSTQPSIPHPTTQVRQEQTTTQPQTEENQPSDQWTQLIQDIENRLNLLEAQTQNYRADSKITSWLGWWWQIGFWSGILLLFPWFFVGWQWTHFKFWGFGWPWPWWFWIPLVWFVPWLIIAWQWWLVWSPWWIWVWWIWPWLFWLFWWVILFKEMTIAQWHRRKGSVTTE